MECCYGMRLNCWICMAFFPPWYRAHLKCFKIHLNNFTVSIKLWFLNACSNNFGTRSFNDAKNETIVRFANFWNFTNKLSWHTLPRVFCLWSLYYVGYPIWLRTNDAHWGKFGVAHLCYDKCTLYGELININANGNKAYAIYLIKKKKSTIEKRKILCICFPNRKWQDWKKKKGLARVILQGIFPYYLQIIMKLKSARCVSMESIIIFIPTRYNRLCFVFSTPA